MSVLTLTSPAPLGEDGPSEAEDDLGDAAASSCCDTRHAGTCGIVMLMVITGTWNYSAYDQLVAHPAVGLENAFSSRTDGLSVLVIGLGIVLILVGAFVGGAR